MPKLHKKSFIRLFGVAILLLMTCQSAYALRSLKVESYTDPDYQGYLPKKVVLLVANAPNEARSAIEERLVEQLAARHVTVIPYRQLLPPTRQWSEQDQVATLEKEGVDSGLIVTIGASASSVIPVATQTYSSANVFGSYGSQGTFNANGAGVSTTYNIFSAKSSAEFSAVLLDIGKNRAIWYADITTKAGGTLFVGARGDAKAAVSGVIKGLEERGHLGRPIRK